MAFNVSAGLPNYTQRNNEYVWRRKELIVRDFNVCNTTSICMGGSYAGWIFPREPYPQYEQEEDRLTAFCLEDPRVSDFYKKILPVFWKEWQDGLEKALPPNQVHRVLEYAANLWMGSKMVTFNEKVNVNDIFKEIVRGLPVVVSGVFPKTSEGKETINHIVVVVGLIYNKKDYTEPESVIIDDPWGNFMLGYEKNVSGNDVICPYELFLKYTKPVNDMNYKWAYRYERGEPVV
jgi:hypothetical protein